MHFLGKQQMSNIQSQTKTMPGFPIQANLSGKLQKYYPN